MRLTEIGWTNYRRMPDARITVRNHLVLVGPNDSGKSSVLRAVHLCIGIPGAHLPAAIQPRDFTTAAQPLCLEVVLSGITDTDRAAFPDEIQVGESETLSICVEAELDPEDHDEKQVRRFFPHSGHHRGLSRVQLDALGWAFVSATRSLIRELGPAAGGAVQSLLSTVDLAADAEALKEAGEQFRAALDSSVGLKDFRTDLAESLSASLSRAVKTDDVQISTAAEVMNDPLAGVALTIRDGEELAPVAEQSDGVRALTLLALLGMSQRGARIVGVDEPEAHLHITAQRSVARMLRHGGGQRVIATHSPSVVGQMPPLDIVALGADRRPRQLPDGADIAEIEATTRHWSDRLIEPLTARRVIVVEGPTDRILCARVADLLGLDLDRTGITIFELDGSGLFRTAYRLFGQPGFDLPLFGLLDVDAASSWAEEIGVSVEDLDANGYVVCDPDLEGRYVTSLGTTRTTELLLSSGQITENDLLSLCGVTHLAELDEAILADYCRHKKRKVRASLAVAAGITKAEAKKLVEISRLFALATACTASIEFRMTSRLGSGSSR